MASTQTRVLVVGGGTAGWMTATYLKTAFGDRCEVTVLESDRVTPVGVGEATFSTIRHFFAYLGMREADWMPRCQATYKLAIRFENWRKPGHHFYHPFERLRSVDGFTLADWWPQVHGTGDRFDLDCFVMATLCDHMRSPRYADGTLLEDQGDLSDRSTLSDQSTQFPYAYHFDTNLLAVLLSEYGMQRGVGHVVDDMVSAELDERGWISHIVTADHGDISADLFVDCTGFRGLLINEALGEPFESFQSMLPNDRAVAFRVPVDVKRDGLRPYTTASAMDNGWVWTIPLYRRIGTGYVYASDYCSPDQAEAALRARIGPAAEGLEANHVRMRIGRSRNSWVNNCVAIGLSSGFIEPLESTGIFFIQQGVEQLVKHFPDERWDPELRDSYNRLIGRCIDGVREFLCFHYCASARADNQYWIDTKRRPLPDGLAERIEQWHLTLPDSESINPYYHGFDAYSWACMQLGLGGIEARPRPALGMLTGEAPERAFRELRAEATRLAETLPSQYEYFAPYMEAEAEVAS